jgi:hypothetical protein
LNTVPTLVWSGIAAAVVSVIVTLITTWLNNREQNTRQDLQLKHDIEQRARQLQHDIDQRNAQFAHDAEQRRTDREMGLRREVYLEAVAALGKLQEFIASYARQDVSENDKLAILQGSTAALNKTHIVGTNCTIEKFSEAQLAFAKCNTRLGSIKLDITKKTIDIEQLQRGLRLLQERREGLLSLNPNPSPHPDDIRKLRSRYATVETEIEKAYSSLDEAQDELFRFQMDLAKAAIESGIEMMRAFSEAAVAVREELRLDLDVTSYRAFLKSHQEKMEQEFSAFVKHVSEKAKDEDGPPS